jgi:DNA modification methylase
VTAPLEVRYRPVASLVLYDRNARTHSPGQIEQIAASIRQFGWTNPVLVDEEGRVIAGHGRLAAAKLLGAGDVPTITIAGLTEAQRRALVLADNKLALNAGWDEALLASELQALRAEDFDIALVGFGQDELARLLPNAGGLTDPDDAPPLPAVAVSRLGDVWILGRHRLVCGDSTDPATVALALNGAVPHLMVTDPPYGVSYDPAWRQAAGVGSAGAATGKVLNDDRADWREAWALFPGSVAYVWHGGLHAGAVAESLASCKFGIRAQIVWVKTRPALSRGHYHWQHEPALYGVREGTDDDGWRFVPEHEVATYAVGKGETASWHGGRKQSTVWFIEHLKSDTGHGTQKPVECMRRPIENNSSVGQAVYEPFSGSGTTLIAAEMTGRACHALELSPGYVDVGVKRWQAFIGKQAVLEATGQPFDVVARERLPALEAA